MARRYELTDEDWERVREHLPPRGTRRGGRRYRDHRQVLDGILWRLHAGAHRRELPGRYGPWKTAYNWLARWWDDGTLDRLLSAPHLELGSAGLIDHDPPSSCVVPVGGGWRLDGDRAGRLRRPARCPRHRRTTPAGRGEPPRPVPRPPAERAAAPALDLDGDRALTDAAGPANFPRPRHAMTHTTTAGDAPA